MITLRQIVQNIGKGQSGVAVRYILMALADNYGKIKSRIKIVNAEHLDDGTTVHLNVPSSDKNISYDVAIWFNTTGKPTLDTELKCYSNSPAFAYNFAYIFNTEGSLLFPEKYPQEFLTMPPKTRNPFGLFGFDKHVFAAVKFLGSKDLSGLVSQYQNISNQPLPSFTQKKAELSRL